MAWKAKFVEKIFARHQQFEKKLTQPSVKQMRSWLEKDPRYNAFHSALFLINCEMVPGNILEFGVGCGKSLALLTLLHQRTLTNWHFKDSVCQSRRIVGFDTFTGLPDSENHPRWEKGVFGKHYDPSFPLFDLGTPITPNLVRNVFSQAALPQPELEVGLFQDTIPNVIPAQYPKAALINIDCDLMSATQCIFKHIEPCLQPGTIILFDDWFCYKGDPTQGEAGAFNLFLQENPQWQAIPYQIYKSIGKSFIIQKSDLGTAVASSIVS